MNTYFKYLISQASRTVKHWWLLLIAGAISIIAGICVFAFPIYSYLTISFIFSILMFITGITQLAMASTSGNYFTMRGYVIVGGVLDLILGAYLCFNPDVTLVVLPVLMGIWMLYHSFILIAFGGDMNTFLISGSMTVVILGILQLALSVFVILDPLSVGVETIIIFAGVGLVLLGLNFLLMSLKLKTIDTQ